jgi:hypothetical protein
MATDLTEGDTNALIRMLLDELQQIFFYKNDFGQEKDISQVL